MLSQITYRPFIREQMFTMITGIFIRFFFTKPIVELQKILSLQILADYL